MNRLYTLFYLVALTSAAFAQDPNPQLQHFEDWLTQQGHVVTFSQTNDPEYDDGIFYYWKSEMDVLKPIHKMLNEVDGHNDEATQKAILRIDSAYAASHQTLEEMVDTARSLFSRLGKDAWGTDLFEYHKDGADTINYSVAFNHGKEGLEAKRFSNFLEFLAPEKAYFRYQARNENIWFPSDPESPLQRCHVDQRIYGYYSHSCWKPRGVADDEIKPFDEVAFEAHIKPALEALKAVNGAKSWPVYWRHDEDYVDEGGFDGNLFIQYFRANTAHAGLTTGTHYFIPAQCEAEFMALRLQLDSLAHDYVNRHPEQPYEYTFIPVVLRILPNYSVLKEDPGLFHETGDIVTNSREEDTGHYYNLRCYCDDEGFHVLSITTDGALWIPKGWQKMKRWVNGKATYRKK